MFNLDVLIFTMLKKTFMPVLFIQGLPVGLFLIGGECVISIIKIMDIRMAKKVNKQ